MDPSTDHAALFADERRLVWSLCYRMTGSAADADDLTQETFLRAIERPPARTDMPWRPWLVRVAMNLARDALRRRRRFAQRQPWLPSPIETGDESAPPAYELPPESGSPTEGRYELLESVSFAFLLALEALTPGQRAVLLLRDVFDYSVRETADALGMNEPAVKTAHHRARRAMAGYDRERCVPTAARQARTSDALWRFMTALQADDVPALEALLAEGVRSISEGGEFAAAHNVVKGRHRVLRLMRGLMRHLGTQHLGRPHGERVAGPHDRLPPHRPALRSARRHARRRRRGRPDHGDPHRPRVAQADGGLEALDKTKDERRRTKGAFVFGL